MIHHIVLLTFRDPGDAPEALRRLLALPEAIPQIHTLKAGLERTDRPDGWHLGLVTEHDDAEALRGYQEHPAHRDFLDWVRDRLAGRATLDWDDPAA